MPLDVSAVIVEETKVQSETNAEGKMQRREEEEDKRKSHRVFSSLVLFVFRSSCWNSG